MTKHTYEYRQGLSLPGYRTKGGITYLLRRDDGKKVKVHRKRFNQLVEEKRLNFKKEEEKS